MPATTSTIPRPSARRFGAMVLAGLLAAPCLAQVPAPFVGRWKVAWEYETRSYEASMTVTEAGGTWQTARLDSRNVCAGREVAMKLESSSEDRAQFKLMFSDVIPGCPDPTVRLKLAPDGSVTGTRSQYPLTMERQ